MLKRQGGNAAMPGLEMAEERCCRSGLILVDVDVDLTVYSFSLIAERPVSRPAGFQPIRIEENLSGTAQPRPFPLTSDGLEILFNGSGKVWEYS